MDNSPSITFEKISNGGSESFPGYANWIAFLDGCPDLLHIPTKKKNSDVTGVDVVTFRQVIVVYCQYRKGQKCLLFETKASKNLSIFCDGKSVSITEKASCIGTYISYENGSFKAERVSTPEGIREFVRSSETNYFVLGNLDLGYSLVKGTSDSSDGTNLLKWKKPNSIRQYYHFYNSDFILIHMFKERSRIEKYRLLKKAYCLIGEVSIPFESRATSLGDYYVALVGSRDLAVFDCSTMNVVRYTFANIPGQLLKAAARFNGDSLAETFISVDNEAQLTIYKAELSRSELAARIVSHSHKKRIDGLFLYSAPMLQNFDNEARRKNSVPPSLQMLNIAAKKMQTSEIDTLKSTVAALQLRLDELEKTKNHCLRDQVQALEQSGQKLRSENENILQKLEPLSAENTDSKKITEVESDKQEKQTKEEENDPTGIFVRMEALEKKYNDTPLQLSKK